MRESGPLQTPLVVTRERGVALLMMMFLLVMAVLIGTQVMERLSQDQTRTENVLLQEQMYAYLLSAEALGVRALAADLTSDRRANKEVDDCGEKDWAVALGPLPWDRGQFSVSIQDLQGRFNLNNIAHANSDGQRSLDRIQMERLKRLLRLTLPRDGTEEAADALVEQAGDWTDSNTLVDGLGGAEDSDYEGWRTGNQLFGSVSELRALQSGLREQWRVMADQKPFSRYITVLPEGTTINVNTAPAEVLQALLPELDSAGVDALVQQRKQKPFTSIDEVMAIPAIAALGETDRNALKTAVGVSSDYFQVVSRVAIGERAAKLVSYVYRPRQKGEARVIMRDLGNMFGDDEDACNPGMAVISDTPAAEVNP